MEVIFFLSTVKSVLVGAKEIHAFLKDEMLNLLTEIGDISSAAAREALAFSKVSKDPEGTIRSVIPLLLFSLKSYENSAVRTSGFLPSLQARILGHNHALHKKAFQTALLLAMCYRLLGEEKPMVHYRLEAWRQFEKYESLYLQDNPMAKETLSKEFDEFRGVAALLLP
ncbi:MAG TPA: hypothetical protein VFQ47_00950 [Nitrososphaera sp.]|jgi:hypothetical protein|nr:hypothetical protein [Nitrososphaera sp.]